ncbi:hypothetical protein Y032_0141g2247 [Ancylostoma ceylanicum]|uniref:Uncharacterized protein n=1 Tax=Ancylostoma ceylanicum TaxID=53326 RepID=A0A016T442_9BILA|nr:hypothetical protein Y032_0141g2247 [Ancylostoma ceylanicum]
MHVYTVSIDDNGHLQPRQGRCATVPRATESIPTESSAIMLFLAKKNMENGRRPPNREEKRLEIALRRWTTSTPARAARLRGVVVGAADGPLPLRLLTVQSR